MEPFTPLRRPAPEKVLYGFAGGSDGAWPNGGLINVHGRLYGTTVEGGSSRATERFTALARAVRKKVLQSFATAGDGGNLDGRLARREGHVYVRHDFLAGGGLRSRGTVYSISTAGVERVLYAFRTARGGRDGEPSYAGLEIDVKGTRSIGTTDQGGWAAAWRRRRL